VRYDVHTHHYPAAYFDLIESAGGDFSFGTDPSGQRIIRYRGSRFFGVTAPMTDPVLRLTDMDRVGIDVAILSLSTPNVFFAEGAAQEPVARMVNDAYAELIAANPQREETPGASAIDGSLPDSLAQEHGERCRLLSRALILPLPALGRHTVDLHFYREEGHMIGTFAGDFEIARKSKPPSLRPFL